MGIYQSQAAAGSKIGCDQVFQERCFPRSRLSYKSQVAEARGQVHTEDVAAVLIGDRPDLRQALPFPFLCMNRNSLPLALMSWQTVP